VVLSGASKSFCAGLDMSNFGDMVSGDLSGDSAASAYGDTDDAGANYVQRFGWGWQTLPDMSGTQSMRHLVRLDRIKELVFTGRKFSGEEAYEYGLATQLSATPLETAMEMAQAIALRNPDAIRAAKRLQNDSVMNSIRDGLVAESNCSRQLMETENQLEGTMLTFEVREPQFVDTA
jgi:enoyl-CoA hydratase/carnithine racemase